MTEIDREKYILLCLPIAILFIFLIFPVVIITVEGLLDESGTSFFDVISSHSTQFTIIFTVSQALVSTILSVAIGLPGALLLSRLEFKVKTLVRALIIIPFVLPPIVVVVGFMQMFGTYGLIDSFVMWILHSPSSVVNIADGLTGIILAHTFYNVPLVILLVSAALERLNSEVEDAAEMLGANAIQRFQRITLPHILPSVVAAAILTFLFCFMSFPIVLALGNGVYKTIEVQIWDSFRWSDYGEASSLVLIQILFTLSLAIAYVRLARGPKQPVTPTSYIRTARFSSYRFEEKILILSYLIFILILIGGPIVAIFRAAVYDPILQRFTFAGFSYLFTSGSNGGLVPLINTLFYGGMATLLSILLGLPLAYAHRSKAKGLPVFSSIMILLPLGISSISMAYGLMTVIAVPTGLNINPWPIIVIAQTIIGLPFTTRSIEISLQNIDPNIIDQADALGASRLQRFFFVELPLLTPGILVGAVFAFAMAIGEMSATLFIALPQNYTLAVAIYNNLGVRKFVQAGASALVLVVFCVIAFLTMEKISEGSTGGAL